ncbi:DUF3800 domain-containing protein [Maricaulis sp.]|uniref:DUF3800 domain-containing protein n=1 Tax=Maricaulis sp. TaxID=1486257 RepID=UPI0026114E47|nr:DUF3800 domain-containing protein [Maricaulis sp.]MDF1767651.1 DUF3800 domain-containing protein [Maricaulis sp.]
MTHSYVAYIDESGDDGFKRFRKTGANGGSSHWLVLSALLFRKSQSLEAVRWRDEIADRMPERSRRDLHFKDLNHSQRIVAAQTIAQKPVRILSVLAAKQPIPSVIYTEKNQLYFYMTRYLIERLSWLCRDLRTRVPEGDGRVEITFSRRGGMSYPAFQDYLRHLKSRSDNDVKVHWPVIDVGAVRALDHSRNASLQLADIAASSVAAAFEPDRYGNVEPRYAQLLKPVTYNRHGNYLSYGLKLVPRAEECGLNQAQRSNLAIWE